MYLMVGVYVMKFSTDVLLISPAIMGIIFGASRVWDAISDPLVGYFSDRTRSSFGRRRTWLMGSIIPVSVSSIMIFAPPESLSEGMLSAWMAVAIIGFYSAMSVFFIPHMSFGAELSENYHDRSRLFGVRYAFHAFGASLALVSFYLLISAEKQGADIVRILAFKLAVFAALFMAILVIYAVLHLRERSDYQGRVNENPLKAFRQIWGNPHARLLYIATFIENLGFAVISVFTLYIIEYVVGAPEWAPLIIFFYMVPSFVSVPLWLSLSQHFGKSRLWRFSLTLTGLSFGTMIILPFLTSVDLKIAYVSIAVALAGFAAGCGGTIPPSIQGDVIDYDEYLTGDRKEGSYFATWNFMLKSAMGVTLLLTGFVLELSGFVPNQKQPMSVQIILVSFYSLFPMACYIGGALAFKRFRLDEAAHAEIRAILDQRNAEHGDNSLADLS